MRAPQGRVIDLLNKWRTRTLSDFAVPAGGGYDGSVIGVTTFGANGLLSSRDPSGGVSSFYTFDAAGNTCQSLTSTGAPNYTHYVSAFGFSRSSGQDLYDGMGAHLGYRDENSGFLYLLGHRHYDAQFGQFMTRDPMGYGGGSPRVARSSARFSSFGPLAGAGRSIEKIIRRGVSGKLRL